MTNTDNDRLVLRCRDPALLRLVIVTPILFTQSEAHRLHLPWADLHFLEATQLSFHWFQAWEANIELRHCCTINIAHIGDVQCHLGLAVSTLRLDVLELELCVTQTEAERKGRGHMHRCTIYIA